MRTRLALAFSLAAAFTGSADAQAPALGFDQAAYVTCRQAQAMTPDYRRAVATFLAETSARRYGVALPEDARGGQIALLVRGGCSLYPDSYLYVVIDRAVQAERANLPKR